MPNDSRSTVRKRGTATVLAVLAVMTVVGATGCGAAPTTRNAAPVSPAPSGTTGAVPAPGAPRPLDDAERARVEDAQQVLIKRCLNRQGFRYRVPAHPSLEESRTLGYVADDVAWARKHGYGSRIAAAEDRARLANPNLVYRKGLSEERRRAYDEALDGGTDAPVITAKVPGGGTVSRQMGGCVAESEKKLYGDTRAWFTAEKTAMNLQPLYVPQVMRDQRFAAALRAWSQCMARAGHPYRDPGAVRRAAQEPALRNPSDRTFAAERRLAVADATCARKVSLRSIGEQREASYVNRLRGRYGEAIDTSRRIDREALARASVIVGPRV